HLTDLLGLRNLLAELSVSLLRLRALTDVGLDSLGDLALGLGGLRHDSSPSCLAWHRQRPGCHPGTDAGPARVSPSVEIELFAHMRRDGLVIGVQPVTSGAGELRYGHPQVVPIV